MGPARCRTAREVAVLPFDRPHERRLDRADGVVLQVRVAREEHLRDELPVSRCRDLEVDVRRPPRVLADRLQVAPDGTLGRHRVRLRQHRLELVRAVTLGLDAAAEVAVGLALVPDVVAARGPGLPDVDDRLGKRLAARRGHAPAHEQHIVVGRDALVLLVDLLPERRLDGVHRPLDVARRRLRAVAGVRQLVDQHRRPRHVGEQDQLVGLGDLAQERERAEPLLLGDLVALQHLVDRRQHVRHDLLQTVAHAPSPIRCTDTGSRGSVVSGISGCIPPVHASSPRVLIANSTVSSTA